jgi:hypothetical protein
MTTANVEATAETPEAVLARWQQEYAATPGPNTVVGSTTQAAYWRDRADRERAIGQLQQWLTVRTQADQHIAVKSEQRTTLEHVYRKRLAAELLALPPRIRDAHTLGEQRNLVLSIRVVDIGLAQLSDTGYDLSTIRLGQLLREAGDEWHGSLYELDRDLKTLRATRDDADVRLARVIANRRQS